MRDYRPVVAVGTLIKRRNEILLIKRAREPWSGKWTIPGGKVKFGETIQDAALREVLEETGLRVRLTRIVSVNDVFQRDRKHEIKKHYVIINFEGRVVGGILRPGTDAEYVKWVKISELHRYDLTHSTKSFLMETLKLNR